MATRKRVERQNDVNGRSEAGGAELNPCLAEEDNNYKRLLFYVDREGFICWRKNRETE